MMKIVLVFVLMLFGLGASKIWDYEVLDAEKKSVNLSDYQDAKVILIGMIHDYH